MRCAAGTLALTIEIGQKRPLEESSPPPRRWSRIVTRSLDESRFDNALCAWTLRPDRHLYGYCVGGDAPLGLRLPPLRTNSAANAPFHRDTLYSVSTFSSKYQLVSLRPLQPENLQEATSFPLCPSRLFFALPFLQVSKVSWVFTPPLRPLGVSGCSLEMFGLKKAGAD
jgi:hypothetical protein